LSASTCSGRHERAGRRAVRSAHARVQDRHVLFTLLEEFQRRADAASPHLTVTHYLDLAESKALVLARAEVSSPELSRDEARALLARLESFYTQPDGQRLVAAFNRGSHEFVFADVLKRSGIN